MLFADGSESHYINSSPPSDPNMRPWIGSVLGQIMACRLFDAKPLSAPMLGNCQIDPKEQTSVKFESTYKTSHSRKCIWKYRLRNGDHVTNIMLFAIAGHVSCMRCEMHKHMFLNNSIIQISTKIQLCRYSKRTGFIMHFTWREHLLHCPTNCNLINWRQN